MKVRVAVSLISLAALVSADTLTLKSGSTINGRFAGGDNKTIRFEIGGQVTTFNLADVDSLRFTPQNSAPPANSNSYSTQPDAPPPPSGPPPVAYSQGAPSGPPPVSYSSSAPTGPPSNSAAPLPPSTAPSNVSNLEVPAGTQIVVRLIDAADSQRDRLGQTYRASVDQPVVVSGQTVIPRGSDAVAVLSDAKQSGKIEGKTMLTIALRSVSVNGQTYDLATSNVNKTSGSRTTKSGEVIGGTAALGAIIGALAGGGRGAAIGAVSGGAVGTGVQVATSGERVRIPSETVLTFALQNPLYITNSRY